MLGDNTIALQSMHNLISIRDMKPSDFREVLRINEDCLPVVSRLSSAEMERLTIDASLTWVSVTNLSVVGYLMAYVGSAAYGGEEFLWFNELTDLGRSLEPILLSMRAWGAHFQRKPRSISATCRPGSIHTIY